MPKSRTSTASAQPADRAEGHGKAQDEVYTSEQIADLIASKAAKPGWSKTVWVHYSDLRPWAINPRLHVGEQPAEIAEMIRAVGFVDPVVIWLSRGELRAGHGRLAAMRLLCETGYRFKPIKGKTQRRAADPGFTAPGAPGPGMVRALLIEFDSEAHANAYAIGADKLSAKATVDTDLERQAKRSVLADAHFMASAHVAGIEEADLTMLHELMDAEDEALPVGDDYDVLARMMGDSEQEAPAQAPQELDATTTSPDPAAPARAELVLTGAPEAVASSPASSAQRPATKSVGADAPVTPQPVLVDLVIPMTPAQRTEVEQALRRVREEEGLEGNAAALLCVMRAHISDAGPENLIDEGDE